MMIQEIFVLVGGDKNVPFLLRYPNPSPVCTCVPLTVYTAAVYTVWANGLPAADSNISS